MIAGTAYQRALRFGGGERGAKTGVGQCLTATHDDQRQRVTTAGTGDDDDDDDLLIPIISNQKDDEQAAVRALTLSCQLVTQFPPSPLLWTRQVYQKSVQTFQQ